MTICEEQWIKISKDIYDKGKHEEGCCLFRMWNDWGAKVYLISSRLCQLECGYIKDNIFYSTKPYIQPPYIQPLHH